MYNYSYYFIKTSPYFLILTDSSFMYNNKYSYLCINLIISMFIYPINRMFMYTYLMYNIIKIPLGTIETRNQESDTEGSR